MHELDQTFHLQQMTSFFSSHPFITIQELLDLRDVPNIERKFYYIHAKHMHRVLFAKVKIVFCFPHLLPPSSVVPSHSGGL